MKKQRVFIIVLLFSIVSNVCAQGINYKALIKDAVGNVVADQSITVQFQILQGAGMTNVYQETHAPTTDANGFVIVNIGEGSVDSGVFVDIDWGSDEHFLNVQINTGGGLVDMGTTQFNAVPYSMHSITATTLPGGIDQDYIAALEARITVLEFPPAKVGDIIAGGVVFWVDPLDNYQGLVCAMSDFGSTVEWGCAGIDLPSVPNVVSNPPTGLGAEIGDGINNTNNILNDCPTAPAALAARSLGPEWFLPSINELKEIYVNKETIEAVPGFSPFPGSLWSSSEYANDYAWIKSLNDGAQGADFKDNTYFVRAIRAFSFNDIFN